MGVATRNVCVAAGVMLPFGPLGTKADSPYERANVYSDIAERQLIGAHVRTVEVEVDIFSGMPNPRWTLSEADADVFLSKLAGLQKAVARPRSVNLGYRGLVVQDDARGRAENIHSKWSHRSE